ncbi:MAG: ribonuclease III [Sphingomonadaceae bacterium]
MNELDERTTHWLGTLGIIPKNPSIWREALTHGSSGKPYDYQRLEFLGDRVLGLAISDWLYERSDANEGTLAQRLNVLVNKKSCAAIARKMGANDYIVLGKQARDDGGADSVNILGDVMEALLGASFLEFGFDQTREWIRSLWQDSIAGDAGRSKHPKSALQEWAAGNRKRMPEYEIIDRSGPDHALNFTVRVHVPNVGDAKATASSKQEAEKLAAEKFLARYG